MAPPTQPSYSLIVPATPWHATLLSYQNIIEVKIRVVAAIWTGITDQADAAGRERGVGILVR